MWIWLIVIASLIALPLLLQGILLFIIAPILIHAKQTLPISPAYRETHLDDLTPEMRDFLARVLEDFRAEEFEVAANVNHPKTMKNTDSFQVLLVNRSTNDLASVIMVHAGGTRALAFSVTSRFPDETRLVTVSNRSLSIFPRDANVDGVNFSWVSTGGALLEAHRRRLSQAGTSGRTRVAPPGGKEVQYLLDEWERELNRFVLSGYKYLHREAGVARLTWKGAFLGSWKLARPVKRWRLALRERKSRRIWKDLGMDSWRPRGRPPCEIIQRMPQGDAPLPVTYDAQAIPSDGGLSYQPVLKDGEIRRELIGDTLIVRIGGPNPGQVLARRWAALLFIAFWLALLGTAFGQLYLLRATVGVATAFRILPLTYLGTIAFAGAALLVEIWRLIRALTRARGTMVVSASQQGVRFANAPAPKQDGEISRDNIEDVRVVLHEGLLWRVYRLEVRRFGGGGAQPLLIGRDKDALEDVAKSIREAMGIDVPKTLPPPLPV